MNKRRQSIALAEQRVAEARAGVLAEYRAVQAKLNRLFGSPAVIGGGLLGAIAVGYLALGRCKPQHPALTERPGGWSRALKTLQVLLPLFLALSSAAAAACRPRANIDGTPR